MSPGWWLLMVLSVLPTVLVVAACIFSEKTTRFLVAWRYRFLGEPDEDGWMAKTNFGRKAP